VDCTRVRQLRAGRLNWEVLDLLKIAGNQAASYLAQNESGKALMVARQFESFNRMSTFVVHDLKNLVSQLSLVLANADRHKESPEFQADMLETIAYSVDKMKHLLQKFSRNTAVEQPVPIKLDQLVAVLVASKAACRPKPVLQVNHADFAVFANWARLERVLSHLVQNAIEATGKDGQVVVRLDRRAHDATVEIEDTGQGMSEDFIEQRLFRPFESTKVAGMGIGVFEMREYILELCGKVEVVSRLGGGTKFTLTLPLHVDLNDAVPAAA
jgi:putative PEP-CTERM system histidine kinase